MTARFKPRTKLGFSTADALCDSTDSTMIACKHGDDAIGFT
jgi:hypothetical protein